ncbi:MAG TPA: hypothetical protein GXZ35_00850 [Acholeplasmataceae bacterium]|nr:hypothetical protein [Acholeplasmataceae bacterium]
MKKIILNMNQSDLHVSFDIVFVNSTLLKSTVVKTEHIALEKGVFFFEKDMSYVISLLERVINENGYQKAPITLSLNSNNLFIETIEIPRLTAQEEKKALQIEMERLYNDYQDRFIFVQKSSLVNKQVKRIKIALYDRVRYKEILNFIKKLKHPLTKVVLTPYSLGQSLSSNRLCDFTKPFVFVNISTLSTVIIVYRKNVESYHISNVGIDKQEDLDSNDYYLLKRDAIKLIANDVKQVLYNTKNFDARNIYLNVENDDDENSCDLLSDYLGYKVMKPIEKQEVLPYLSYLGSLSVINNGYIFPTRIQVSKKK